MLTRADGTVIDLGIVAAAYADPDRQAAWDTTGSAAAAARIEAANALPRGETAA